MEQITINFEAGLSEAFATCREYVAHRAQHQGRYQKEIAMDMDYSPTQFSRKLAGGDTKDKARFTLDDLERFIEVTGDIKPVLYLVDKYLSNPDEKAALLRRLKEIEQAERVSQLRDTRAG